MVPDFNNGLKGFVESSAVFKKVLAETQKDPNTQDTVLAEYAAAAKAVFEAVVIYLTLVPNQTRQIMRGSVEELIHDYHSPESKTAAKKLAKTRQGIQKGEFIKSMTLVVLTRRGNEEALGKELAAWSKSQKADAAATASKKSKKMP